MFLSFLKTYTGCFSEYRHLFFQNQRIAVDKNLDILLFHSNRSVYNEVHSGLDNLFLNSICAVKLYLCKFNAYVNIGTSWVSWKTTKFACFRKMSGVGFTLRLPKNVLNLYSFSGFALPSHTFYRQQTCVPWPERQTIDCVIDTTQHPTTKAGRQPFA